MVPGDLLVFLGLNGRVAALLRKDGQLLWATDLPGIVGDRFVTLTCDETRVYAYTRGRMHCLDMDSGRILWSNNLEGFGYGFASLCVPGVANDTVSTAQARTAANHRD